MNELLFKLSLFHLCVFATALHAERAGDVPLRRLCFLMFTVSTILEFVALATFLYLTFRKK